MNNQKIMKQIQAITESRKSNGQTVSFKMPADDEWQKASFSSADRAEWFKARVTHQGGKLKCAS